MDIHYTQVLQWCTWFWTVACPLLSLQISTFCRAMYLYLQSGDFIPRNVLLVLASVEIFLQFFLLQWKKNQYRRNEVKLLWCLMFLWRNKQISNKRTKQRVHSCAGFQPQNDMGVTWQFKFLSNSQHPLRAYQVYLRSSVWCTLGDFYRWYKN